jgi:hypothetical protein
MLRRLFARHAVGGVVLLTFTVCFAFAEDKGPTIGGRTENPDGSAKLSVGRKLPTEWDTRVGADFNLTAPVSNDLQRPDRPADPNARSTGSAWATLTMPGLSAPIGWDKTTIEGRVDPLHEQGKLGTRFSRSMPVGDGLAVVLEDGYAVTPTLRNGATPPPPGAAAETWETDKTARLKVAPTETTFSVGKKMNGVDQKWLSTFGAEQKVIGPLTVKGGVSETPTGAYDRSISVGFKTAW